MRAPAVWFGGRSSLRRERFTRAWYSRCFWHVAAAGIAGGCAVALPAQKSSAVVLGHLWSPVPEQPGSVSLHGRNQTGFCWGSAANAGRAVSHPGCCCFPGSPPALPKLTLSPVGAAASCGRSRCCQSCWVEGISRAGARVWWGSTAGASGGRCGLLGCQSTTGDRVLPRSGVVEQKAMKEKKENSAESMVPVALPCSNQGLTAPGLGCVCGAGQKDPPHLPARERCVLLHRALRDGNTM